MTRFKSLVVLAVPLLFGCALDRRAETDPVELPVRHPLRAEAYVGKYPVQEGARATGKDWFEDLSELIDIQEVTSLQLISATPAFDMLNDAQMTHLSKFPKLENLIIINAAVTDKGIRHVAACKNLRRVVLESLQITDAGLLLFKDTPRLEWMSVPSSLVTQDGIRALQKARPDIEINRWVML